MVPPDIASGQIGPESTYDIAFTGGVISFTIGYKGTQGNASFTASENLSQLLTALAGKVSNTLEKEALTGAAALIAAIP